MKQSGIVFFALAATLGGTSLACGSPDAEGSAPAVAETSVQPPTRIGAWELESADSAAGRKTLSYERHGDGLRIVVEMTSAAGEVSSWSYVTMLDGEFRAVDGLEDAYRAVEVVDDSTHRMHRKDPGVEQVIVSVLSEDGEALRNEYTTTAGDGTQRTTRAVYRRISSSPSNPKPDNPGDAR